MRKKSKLWDKAITINTFIVLCLYIPILLPISVFLSLIYLLPIVVIVHALC